MYDIVLAMPQKINTSGLRRTRGRGLPGWEKYSIEAVAAQLGLSPRHLRESLTGQRNCTLDVYRKVAGLLGMKTTQVISRVEASREARGQ